jgi:xanthosine utilization system XapX-like protein
MTFVNGSKGARFDTFKITLAGMDFVSNKDFKGKDTLTMNLSGAVTAGIVAGGVIGVINGLAITRLRVVPFIATLGMLGIVSEDGTAQVTPVWITLDGDTPVFSTVMGSRKERHMRRDPRVTLTIVDPEDAYELHMNLIRHGREVCRPRPHCGECGLRRMCPYWRRLKAITPG